MLKGRLLRLREEEKDIASHILESIERQPKPNLPKYSAVTEKLPSDDFREEEDSEESSLKERFV
jgi:hypothetical protein